MKVIIFGSNGMLGEYVKNILSSRYDIIPLARKDFDFANISEMNRFLESLRIPENAVMVNCAVIRRDRIQVRGIRETIIVNSLLPHILSDYSEKSGALLIHISSDCVFSGKTGNYSEHDPHDPVDDDGRTKSLGEPENSTVIRTSIIGEETGEKRSLLEWVRSQKGTIRGYADYCWNGVTCLQLAKEIRQMIDEKIFWKGVRHIFIPNVVSKHDLVSMINTIYSLGLNIEEFRAGFCDRSLSTIYALPFIIPRLEEQIIEMRDYNISGINNQE